MGAGGSCSTVAEHWHGRLKASVLTHGSSTFLSCSFAIFKGTRTVMAYDLVF